jgi:hypothetical protein
MTTIRRLLTQTITVPAGNLYPEGTYVISNNSIVDATNGAVIIGSGGSNTNVTVISIDGGNANGGGGIEESNTASNTVGLSTRVVVTTSVSSIAANAIGTVNVSGFKSYTLYGVSFAQPAWIRIYTSNAARAADANRAIGADPVPGSGVLAEVITTANAQQFIMTPPVIGFNSETPVTNTIYVAVKNTSNTSIPANPLYLTLLQTEA